MKTYTKYVVVNDSRELKYLQYVLHIITSMNIFCWRYSLLHAARIWKINISNDEREKEYEWQ